MKHACGHFEIRVIKIFKNYVAHSLYIVHRKKKKEKEIKRKETFAEERKNKEK